MIAGILALVFGLALVVASDELADGGPAALVGLVGALLTIAGVMLVLVGLARIAL